MALDLESVKALVAEWGYLIVFFTALGEAMPILSLIVPGGAFVAVAGALAALGYLDIRLVILVAIPGGIIGDWAGFWLGRRYGRDLVERYGPRFRVKPAHIEATDRVFEKYGPFALVVFRFSFLTRPIGPIFCGMSRMGWGVFWVWNVVGAVLWAIAYALAGYFAGFGFLQLEGIVGVVLAWTVVGAVGIYVLYRLLKKYAANFTRDDLYVALLGISGGTAFGVLVDRVARLGEENLIDRASPYWPSILAPFDALFQVLDAATSWELLLAASLAASATLFLRRMRWQAALLGLAVAGATVGTHVVRAIIGPLGLGSFPSLASTLSLVIAGTATYVVASASHRGGLVVAVVGGMLAGIAALARAGRGLENPSAVFGGLALGAAWLAVSILLVEFALKRDRRAVGNRA